MPKLRHPDRLGLHLRVVLADGIAIGPGRADLLEAIRDHGSISAAGRALGMSYKRAWDLIEQMNAAFSLPVIATSTGGVAGGGSHLTQTGATILDSYRRLEQAAAEATASERTILTKLLAIPTPS